MSLVMVVKNLVEELFNKSLKSLYFKTGDGLAREVGRHIKMPVKFETVENVRDGCKGFLTVCNGFEIETTGWHGSKSGAENIAGWKWLKAFVDRYAIDKVLYHNLVKRFTFSIVDVETNCRLCKASVDLEELWDHVEKCMEVHCINYWYERQSKDTIKCQFCSEKVSLINVEDYIEEFSWMDCVKCGLRIKKLEATEHLNDCGAPVVELIKCPDCHLRLESGEFENHWQQCDGRDGLHDNECRLCGENNSAGHDCGKCPTCLVVVPVKKWMILSSCSHVICETCAPRLKKDARNKGNVFCATCRATNPTPFRKLFF